MEPELIKFNERNTIKNKLPSFSLLINPEALTLAWRKVINRVRTKTRLVTLFWGEEPVKFTYNGQTGYIRPEVGVGGTGDWRAVEAYNKDQIKAATETSEAISELESQLRTNGPYTVGSLEATIKALKEYKQEIKKYRIIQPGELVGLAGEKKTNTELLLASYKFQQLKKLEKLYTKHQDPTYLIDVKYRKYIFEGYFESFSFTDDARNPWNWRYVIDFTILTWEEHESAIKAQDEYLFVTIEEGGEKITGEFTT